MTTCCEFHGINCNQGRACPLRGGEQEIDRAIANSQMPGASLANVLRSGVPVQTAPGVVVGGAYLPPRSPAYANSMSHHRRRSAAQRFFARLAAWLLS